MKIELTAEVNFGEVVSTKHHENTVPMPRECQRAINFTEFWRLEHRGMFEETNLTRRQCDLQQLVRLGNPWFRFAGDAGTHLLDHCPATNGKISLDFISFISFCYLHFCAL